MTKSNYGRQQTLNAKTEKKNVVATAATSVEPIKVQKGGVAMPKKELTKEQYIDYLNNWITKLATVLNQITSETNKSRLNELKAQRDYLIERLDASVCFYSRKYCMNVEYYVEKYCKND